MPDGGSYTGTPAGTVTDRTGLLISQVQVTLATFDQKKLSEILKLVPEKFIYDKLQRAQEHLAQEFLCIEKSDATLTMTSGVITEPTGFYRIKQIVLPSGQYVQPVEVDIEVYDQLTRTYFTAGQEPTFYKRWGGSITFFPTPSDGTYTMHYYGVPTTQIAQSQNPETPQILDEALFYFAMKECAPAVGRLDLVPLYEGKYMAEKSRSLGSWQRAKTINYAVEYQDI